MCYLAFLVDQLLFCRGEELLLLCNKCEIRNEECEIDVALQQKRRLKNTIFLLFVEHPHQHLFYNKKGLPEMKRAQKLRHFCRRISHEQSQSLCNHFLNPYSSVFSAAFLLLIPSTLRKKLSCITLSSASGSTTLASKYLTLSLNQVG